MESLLRAALINWLSAAPELSGLNAIEEESPLRASPPWLGLAASTAGEWGSKDRDGRDVRIALELVTRGDEPSADAELIRSIEACVSSLPKIQDGFEIATNRFLRSRAEKRGNNLRAALLEFRFRILSTYTE